MQHTILSEKISGLTTSLASLNTLKLFDEHNNTFLTSLYQSIKSLFSTHKALQSSLEEITLFANQLIQDSDLARHLKGLLIKSEETILKPYKTLVSSLKQELESLKNSNLELSDKNSVLEMRVFNFLQEVEKHRRNTRLSLLFTDPTEKICGNCQKVFKASENFNWSCRHHKAKIVGSNWFCCGKVGAKAEGCIVNRHVSVEEMEETRGVKTDLVFCCNCRNKEHRTGDCPQDPNVRSSHEPNSELKRLQQNLQLKAKKSTKVMKFNRSLVFRNLRKSRRFLTEDSEISDMDISSQIS